MIGMEISKFLKMNKSMVMKLKGYHENCQAKYILA